MTRMDVIRINQQNANEVLLILPAGKVYISRELWESARPVREFFESSPSDYSLKLIGYKLEAYGNYALLRDGNGNYWKSYDESDA